METLTIYYILHGLLNFEIGGLDCFVVMTRVKPKIQQKHRASTTAAPATKFIYNIQHTSTLNKVLSLRCSVIYDGPCEVTCV